MGFLINPFFVAPAGVTPASFTPLRWYDAATYALADGATITTAMPWDDLSLNNSDATTTLGFEPTFRTNIFGALPAVRLLTPQHLAFTGDLVLTDLTIICVAKVNGDSIWLSRSGLNRQIRVFRSGANVYSFVATAGEVVSGVLSQPATDARMNTWRHDFSGTTQVEFFENATLFAGGVNGQTQTLNQIGIIDGGPLNIDIGEMVIYDSSLSDTNVIALYNDYFKPKFGLP